MRRVDASVSVWRGKKGAQVRSEGRQRGDIDVESKGEWVERS